MNNLHIKVKSFERKSIEDVERYVSEICPDFNIINSQESIIPDVLEDGTLIFLYYVYIERKVD